MKRYFFFALFFPPAFMNLMLVLAQPASVPRYFIAGYVIATLPAVLVALLDELLQRRTLIVRAGVGAVAAFISVPAFFVDGLWRFVEVGCLSALAAFFCVVAFARFKPRDTTPKMLLLPAPASRPS